MSAAADTVIAVILSLSAFLLPLNGLDVSHLQSWNVTHKLPARTLFSFKSSNEFLIMDLPRGKLCSQFSKMKELKSIHSWIYVRKKPPTRQNIMKEVSVTEDFSDRKLHVQPQHLLGTLCTIFAFCGGLTLAGSQLPTTASLSLPYSTGQGRQNIKKGSWVGISMGKVHSLITITSKIFSLENINSIKTRVG